LLTITPETPDSPVIRFAVCISEELTSQAHHLVVARPKPVIIDGRKFSTDHLAPMSIRCRCEDVDHNLSICVDFSNHCYTERFDVSRHDWTQIIVRDSGGARVFCQTRHGLSLRLPDIVRRLPEETVYQTTQKRNYVYAVPLDIAGQLYEIFFMLQRADSDLVADLRMTIESAYPTDDPSPRPKRPNGIRFKVLAFKVLRRQPVRFAPR
jgi:hypothetical protein